MYYEYDPKGDLALQGRHLRKGDDFLMRWFGYCGLIESFFCLSWVRPNNEPDSTPIEKYLCTSEQTLVWGDIPVSAKGAQADRFG
jgi:hypothetical protein